MFVLELIKRGRRRLSTILITKTPKARRTIAFKNIPWTNKKMLRGIQMRAVPPIGMKERRAIAVPQKMGAENPRTHRDNPPKVP